MVEENKKEEVLSPVAEEPENTRELIKALTDALAVQKKEIGILMQTADKRAIARYYKRNKGDMPPIVSLRSIDVYDKKAKKPITKVIVGWRMIEDKGSYQIPGTGKWTEYQVLEIIYQDGTSEEMSYEEFERRYDKHIKAKRVGVIVDDVSGKEALKLQRIDTGEELTIGVEFVN